jgi:hypothetical protein
MSGVIYPLPQYTFMACVQLKHRDNFTSHERAWEVVWLERQLPNKLRLSESTAGILNLNMYWTRYDAT